MKIGDWYRQVFSGKEIYFVPAAAPGGPLSPRFVEWIMGFPDGWTDCGR